MLKFTILQKKQSKTCYYYFLINTTKLLLHLQPLECDAWLICEKTPVCQLKFGYKNINSVCYFPN